MWLAVAANHDVVVGIDLAVDAAKIFIDLEIIRYDVLAESTGRSGDYRSRIEFPFIRAEVPHLALLKRSSQRCAELLILKRENCVCDGVRRIQ